MYIRYFTLSLLVTSLVSADLSNYWQSLPSQIDPRNITIPSIPQTTSNDPVTECTYYNTDPALVLINNSEWPNIWEIATSNNIQKSEEFTSLYNSINWTDAPNIPVRKVTANGGLDFSGYSSESDPDCWWSSSLCTQSKLADVNEDIVQCPEPETYGLTYDDGPNCSQNAFYNYLEEQQLKATMFYIGSNVIGWPYGALRGVKDGHHVAGHTWSHQYTTSLNNEEVLAELYYTQKAIKLATGLTPRYWRPPYGDVDDRVRWIASQLGLTAVMWNLDTNDWEAGFSATIEEVQNNYDAIEAMGSNGTFSSSGNIVLSHEINNTTMTLAIDNLPKIVSAYKQVLDVATCYNISQPYFEDFEWTRTLNNSVTPAGNSSLPATNSSSTSDIASESATATAANGIATTKTTTDSANESISSGAYRFVSNSIFEISVFTAALLYL